MHQTSLTRAANNIISQSLQLRKDQNLLIFADPGSLDVANLVAETAQRGGVAATIFFVPYLFQVQFGITESLPLPVEAAIRECDAVLSCLSDRPEYLAYRRRVLRTSWSRRIKMAHAPGITLDILRLADTDYDLIRERCQLLATALVLGRQAEIITTDSHGCVYRLEAEIAGWDFTPGISDGIIGDGTWANLPPGETFIVPPDANGEIVVNGSLPGRVFQAGEELVLNFRKGKLAGIDPADSPAAQFLRATQIAYAESLDDPNWCTLAEIGFGVNPAVQHLTGIALVDEKKAGTIHVALGDNHSLGGNVESTIHCDMVIEGATVRVDGKPLLQAGQWLVDETDWRPDHRTVSLPAEWWASVSEIRRSGARAERSGEGLVRQWNSGPGRWDSTPVGSEATARLAARIYQTMPNHGAWISRAELVDWAQRHGLDEQTVAAVLWVMRQYDLVRLPGESVS
jgi:leucyl aminopeptidase (aminopeptidase T)